MKEKESLYILWTNDNLDTSRLMVMMYSTNSMLNRLWKSVTVIMWGAPVGTLARNDLLKEQMKMAQHAGVKFSACKNCARQLGVADELEELGVEVAPWVEPFTDLVKSGETIIYI